MSRPSAVTHLAQIIESGRRASAVTEHTTPGFSEPLRFSRKPAVASGSLDIRSLFVMPSASQTAQVISHTPSPSVPVVSKTIPLDAAIIGNSRVASLGASIIVAAERDMAAAGAIPILYRDAGLFRIVEPAPFGLVADGAQANVSPRPWFDAAINWPDAPSIAFNVAFTRADMRAVGSSLIDENLLTSIVAGLARAADACLLSAIAAAAPAPFTLAAAAARGLRFDQIGAMVGTAGTGAVVGQDGRLRSLGIAAELTDTVAPTIIGAFEKSAVAIYPEVQVHIARLNVDGSLSATVFANLMPLVPDASAFWVGA